MGIYIDVYGNVELRVPKACKEEHIVELVESKWSWIVSKEKEMRERTKGFRAPPVYEDGEEFLYLGGRYPIEIVEGGEEVHKEKVEFENEVLRIFITKHDDVKIKKLMERYYKQRCKALVSERIRHYQPNFRVKPRGIKISGNKKTWGGTCNSKRELTFNWKLAMAPLDVIDYIVIHEMCHMVHMNHDRSFWRLVGKYMPNYDEKQAWLANSHWKMVL